MCCLFGLIDYGHQLSGRQKTKMIRILAQESEARGTDAAGIAYYKDGVLHVDKRPGPAHLSRFRVPKDAWTVMGHTRMTTQGNASKNRNNHPFVGHIGNEDFALAHNGVLYNDMTLQRTQHLPKTNIETVSYVAVQLLEKANTLDFTSLQSMAEKVQGSFVFTVLDQADNLYFVKGDNPLCLVHYPKLKLYVYASTPQIMSSAIARISLLDQAIPTEVDSICGDILCIDRAGDVSQAAFDTRHLWSSWYYQSFTKPATRKVASPTVFDAFYWDELKSIAGAYGYTPESIDELRELGFTTDEIEELIYFGEL